MSDELAKFMFDDMPYVYAEKRPVGHGRTVLQVTYRFPNGRGASVIEGPGTDGLELAVTQYTGDGLEDYVLDYSTPITQNTVGWIEGRTDLYGYLCDIRDLPPRSPLARDPKTYRGGITRDDA